MEQHSPFLVKLFGHNRAKTTEKRFLPAVALTFAISFLLTLYAPLEMYFTNKEEFHFDALVLLPELLKLFLLVAAAGLICFGLCYLIFGKLYHVALVAAVVVYVCTYIQGMFLVGNLPPLDGTTIDWSEYTGQHTMSIILWIAVSVAAVLLVRFLKMKKMYSAITGCSAFLTAVLLSTLVVVCWQYDGLSPKSEAVVTKENEFTMSTEQNFVIFVIDAADSATFNQMLQTDYPQFRDVLEDFTYYPNTVCAYPFTKHSIPFILNGTWYENQADFYEFTTQAMDESPLFRTLKSQDYRMGVYEEDFVYENEHIFDFENVKKIQYKFSSFRQLARAEAKLVWFKYAPYPLKRYAKVDMQEFGRLLSLDNDVAVFSANNVDFYQDAKNMEIIKTDDKCFRFIHIEGAHVPFRYDKDVKLIDESEGTYLQNMECSMTILAEYLGQLKEAGVYDNCAIIVMADHGYGYEREIPILGRANPLLAVKGVSENHEMQVSEAPISFEDLQEAYQRLLAGKPGDQVFDAREGEPRVRRFLAYLYEQDEYIQEYKQHGYASDIMTMEPTENLYMAQ